MIEFKTSDVAQIGFGASHLCAGNGIEKYRRSNVVAQVCKPVGQIGVGNNTVRTVQHRKILFKVIFVYQADVFHCGKSDKHIAVNVVKADVGRTCAINRQRVREVNAPLFRIGAKHTGIAVGAQYCQQSDVCT